jgi:SAM-dependent methyltransferase
MEMRVYGDQRRLSYGDDRVPLCGAAQYHPENSGPDLFMSLPGMFHLVCCAECGMLYQNPRPPLAEIGRYYHDHYGSYVSAQAGLRARPELMGWIIWRGLNKRCHPIDRGVPSQVQRARRYLDVGCGSGLFREAMQSHGWQVEGVELNETAGRVTSARLGVPVFIDPFEAAHYPDASFDAGQCGTCLSISTTRLSAYVNCAGLCALTVYYLCVCPTPPAMSPGSVDATGWVTIPRDYDLVLNVHNE